MFVYTYIVICVYIYIHVLYIGNYKGAMSFILPTSILKKLPAEKRNEARIRSEADFQTLQLPS